MNTSNTLALAVKAYLDKIQADWQSAPCHDSPNSERPVLNFDLDYGRKYLRIWTSYSYTPGVKGQPTCHSFVVLKDTKASKRNPVAFKVGDILKCASWQQPATNYCRGSVFHPASYQHHRWMGAA